MAFCACDFCFVSVVSLFFGSEMGSIFIWFFWGIADQWIVPFSNSETSRWEVTLGLTYANMFFSDLCATASLASRSNLAPLSSPRIGPFGAAHCDCLIAGVCQYVFLGMWAEACWQRNFPHRCPTFIRPTPDGRGLTKLLHLAPMNPPHRHGPMSRKVTQRIFEGDDGKSSSTTSSSWPRNLCMFSMGYLETPKFRFWFLPKASGDWLKAVTKCDTPQALRRADSTKAAS